MLIAYDSNRTLFTMDFQTLSPLPPGAPTREKQARCVYLAGVGHVGRALLHQLHTLPASGLRLVGACTTRRAVWAAEGLPPAHPFDNGTPPEPTDWRQILTRIEQHPALIFVDATGSPDVARYYPRLMQAGTHIVTSSKRANTFEQAFLDTLLHLSSVHGAHYRYETTVGAGLPIVQVIRDLVATGDRIQAILGCASGTLTYLFDRLDQGVTFSRAVQEAVERGYAEPDVRDDLSGEDVARKFMILARTAGWRVEREAVAVESLVPAGVQAVAREQVLAALEPFDAAWARRAETARRAGHTLRYVGRLAGGQISVGVQAVPTRSALGQLDGTDNLFQIHTERYTQPIIIRGPGAGPDVTAAGVLADILKVARARD